MYFRTIIQQAHPMIHLTRRKEWQSLEMTDEKLFREEDSFQRIQSEKSDVHLVLEGKESAGIQIKIARMKCSSLSATNMFLLIAVRAYCRRSHCSNT